jgi:hypothetical protein
VDTGYEDAPPDVYLAKEFTLERTGLLGSTVSRVAVQGLTDICGANRAVFSGISVARYGGSLRVKGELRDPFTT